MRTPEDALRSVKRYVSEILSPQPVLSELVSSDGVHWTLLGRVDGAINVERPSWEFLRSRNRFAPTVVGSPDDPEVYFLSGALVEDAASLADACADDPTIDLRLAAPANIGWRLPLQPDWEVRLAFDYAEVPDDRPFAKVGLVGSVGTSGPSLYYEMQQPMSIECLPLKPETADEANVNAMRVMAALLRGFRGPGVGLGRPIRIPLYDYEGVALEAAATQRYQSDFLRVSDFSVRLLPDPNDVRVIPVVADLRVSWRNDNDLVEVGTRGTRTVETVLLSGSDEVG